ncbi:MGMT family protein [Aquibacillus rhizosphaerae]|uniref:MGMT family protein n=1 Tax=Aquibacillus rhizosphaerae TaxID=3051431 RepID=A0ABT7L3M9_9BACI|nr:MGMT family protein [Aquibacillus sp. LR5S19]MDL4840463.1 MGMT family protein [Aquibacillus sp. LR5S19]
MNDFTKTVVTIIKGIPYGKVMTYGQIAKVAGNPRAARQVSRVLHSMSRKYELPWHRVINSQGKISLKDEGYTTQRILLEKEGVEFDRNNKVYLAVYQQQCNKLYYD